MTMLDIGGGFCGGNFGANGKVDLGGVPAAVNAALDEHFPLSAGKRLLDFRLETNASQGMRKGSNGHCLAFMLRL